MTKIGTGIGERIAGNNGRRLQAREPKPNEWNAAKRAIFLDHLAATCNVVQSAKAAGMSSCAAHALRRRNTDFAEQWSLALAAGYEHLEAKLLARALGEEDDPQAIAPGTDPTTANVGAFNPDAAMDLLRQHQGVLAAGGTSATLRKKPHAFKHAPIEEVQRELMKRLAAIARRRKPGGAA